MQYLSSVGYNMGGFNNACNSTAVALPSTYAGCVPFGDMDANYSNGSSIYHGFSANLRKRFNNHYEFLASYTWSHAIDDSTDLQSTLTPQDSYYSGLDRSTSLFDQRHRFVFSGVLQTGKITGGFSGKVWSDWTFAPIVEVASGRPFNILTGGDDNFQLSSLTGRPNVVAAGTPQNACDAILRSLPNFSPSGFLQEPCSCLSLPRPQFPSSLFWDSMAILDATPACSLGRSSMICAWPSESPSENALAWI